MLFDTGRQDSGNCRSSVTSRGRSSRQGKTSTGSIVYRPHVYQRLWIQVVPFVLVVGAIKIVKIGITNGRRLGCTVGPATGRPLIVDVVVVMTVRTFASFSSAVGITTISNGH